MREIINLAIGQCGNQVGTAFWDKICGEHGLDRNGNYHGNEEIQQAKLDVYFNEVSSEKYIPRAVLVDLDPAAINEVKDSKNGTLFTPDNLVSGQRSTENIWSTGFHTSGAELADSVMDVVRREAEACDFLQGFQITHSLSGGTGSGMGSLLMTKIREEYPDRMMATFSVVPSEVNAHILDPYNAAFSIHHLIENSDETFCIDNDALSSICRRTSKFHEQNYAQMNNLASSVMSGVTSSLRYPGQLNSDLRKLAVNLVSFPRLHFFSVGHAPLPSNNSISTSPSVSELTHQIFNPENMITTSDPTSGRCLAGAAFFRGNFSVKEIEDEMHMVGSKYESSFFEWIPNNVQTTICSVPSEGSETSVSFIANNTSIKDLFIRVGDQFRAMFRKRAFILTYTSMGMDEIDFIEAEYNINDLISEYHQDQDAEIDDDEEN
ncbi:tubulin beta chain [[Candida] railenensis]|uniref:Tubulin beta chain n=1 Tax=[Candida] railenensis TaxID=45579 RepID=A0A9P0QQP4_9ASCO|nr:tubulin beta chain [[Candida] railenensis]